MLNGETGNGSRIELPTAPAEVADDAVIAWSQPVTIDTYSPEAPDDFPAFLEKRVYQGSSGRVYPLPFHERIAAEKQPREWQAIHLENQFVRLMIMPELGGRIHIAYDKTNGYDFFYRNNVIKPALVGLAGPWISGGVEFNWPQHHRPGTFLPSDVEVEREADGSVTVWCSDHDPFTRMKGMHGIRLRPDSSAIEARVRLYNRSETTQTFLWWANVAALVGDDYQSFFPTDVQYVADHAKRAVVTFPRVEGLYYGVDYPARVDAEHPDADRLDWYRNIPVPTSYMVTETDHEFFGGYDHGQQAGFVHVADRHVSPGKKQWTWGNAPFGLAWDDNLTDGDGPYVELMAGVYTDNQPDFAYLASGETKTFSQFWYPIQQIGTAHIASVDLAARLEIVDGEVRLGIAPATAGTERRIVVTRGADTVLDETVDFVPGTPHLLTAPAGDARLTELTLRVTAGSGGTAQQLLEFQHEERDRTEPPAAAVEPPLPSEIATIDELILVGGYLAQYRHATRAPEPYWEEALRRDAGETRAHTALGWRAYRRGLYADARAHFSAAASRQTRWVPTPETGEALYGLGLTLVRLGELKDAADRLGRAAWDAAFATPASFALARLEARAGERDRAIERLSSVVARDPQHLQSRDLLAALLEESGSESLAASGTAAARLLDETLALDPLDQWALHLAGLSMTHDSRTLLDVAREYASAGLLAEALGALGLAEQALGERAIGETQVAPILAYEKAAILERLGRTDEAAAARAAARSADIRWCFPSGLDDLDTLQTALHADPRDAVAALLIGHWFYDARRYEDSIHSWEKALGSGLDDRAATIAHRNLGIAAYNVIGDRDTARRHYDAAVTLSPRDAKLRFEADQLAARLGDSAEARLTALESVRDLIETRDDLSVAYATLLMQTGRAGDAQRFLAAHTFQPWEGGEGQVLTAWELAALVLAEQALEQGAPEMAIDQLGAALEPPRNLGEARHLLVNDSRLRVALGRAFAAAGRDDEARAQWLRAASFRGDFSNMSTQPYSRQTAHSIEALRLLGEHESARQLTESMATWVEELAATPATIDYFATSLPTMLLFVDDPQTVQDDEVAALRDLIASLRGSDPAAPDGHTTSPGADADAMHPREMHTEER